MQGYVVALPIDDNMNVKEGDFLLQIDPREYKAEVDQAKAALDLFEAEANSAELQIGLTCATTVNVAEPPSARAGAAHDLNPSRFGMVLLTV